MLDPHAMLDVLKARIQEDAPNLEDTIDAMQRAAEGNGGVRSPDEQQSIYMCCYTIALFSSTKVP
jgi:hypothetical protein